MKNQKIWRRLHPIAGGAVLFLAACDPGEVSSGVDGEKKGSELTVEESRMVCEAIVDYQKSAISDEDACKVYGEAAARTAYGLNAGDESIQKACRDAVESCKSDDARTEESRRVCANVSTADDCSATVDDIESCATERIDAAALDYSELPGCASFTRLYFEQDQEPDKDDPKVEPSRACKNVQERCAQVMNWGGGF